MAEYEESHAALQTLYAIGIPGNEGEFTAYRILLLMCGRNHNGLSAMMALDPVN